jgi:ribosome-associated protein
MEKIKIKSEFIKLDQFLKWCGLVTDGSDAKYLIINGYVYVNDEVEKRRGKKLFPGNIIEIKYDDKLYKYTIEKEE